MTSKMIFTFVITITAMLNLVSSAATNRPEYIGCQTNDECAPGFCCSMMPDKYSIPRCNPLKQEGENCRPASSSTFNTTLHYPDGAQVELTNVHYIMCPCSNGLTCDTSDGICRDQSQKNEIHGEFDTQDE